MPNDKILALAKKLKALAERGVDGEKINAEKLLNKLLAEHNISLEEINSDVVRERCFSFKDNKHRKFIHQIIASVVGSEYRAFCFKGVRGKMYIELNDADYIEVEMKLDIFWREYLRQEKLFYQAFVQKNQLYTKETGETPEREYSEEELNNIREMLEIAAGMKKVEIHKQITN